MTRGKKSQQKIGRCAFCAARGPITREHLPAKSLFPPPLPSNLITVPSCLKCNQGWQSDQDYFRLFLVARADTKGNRARDALFPAVKRSLSRAEARGFATSFFSKLEETGRLTPTGIYIGTGISTTFDFSRLDHIAEKIVRGLFYHETERRLPADFRVATYHESRVRRLPSSTFKNDLLGFVSMALETPPRRFGSAFAYWYLPSPNGWAHSHWLLEFYGSREYYCFTAPIIGVPGPSPALPK